MLGCLFLNLACEPDMMPSFPQHRLKRKASPSDPVVDEPAVVAPPVPEPAVGLFDAAFDRIVSCFVFWRCVMPPLTVGSLKPI